MSHHSCQAHRGRPGIRLRLLSRLSLLGVFFACSAPDVSSPPVPAPGATFWALTLQAHAITISTVAPYDTLQLVATPRSALGTPLIGVPAPTFFTTDSSVRVSSTGLLTARAVRSNVKVVATLTYQGVHLTDTAVITVTDPAVVPPRPAAALMLAPAVAGDTTLPVPTTFSAFYGADGRTQLQVEVRDAGGAPIPEALLALSTSAAPGVAAFPNGAVTTSGPARLRFTENLARPGVVRVYGDATVYGVTVRDTLALTLTNPALEFIRVTASVVPGSPQKHYTATPAGVVTVGVGGTVWWWNSGTEDSLDVVFDDPTAAVVDPVTSTFFGLPAGAGDIAPFPGDCAEALVCDNLRARQFPRAGTFPWHSPKTGLAGTILVQ